MKRSPSKGFKNDADGNEPRVNKSKRQRAPETPSQMNALVPEARAHQQDVVKSQSENDGGWFGNAISAVAGFAVQSIGGIANAAAEMNVVRAIELARPLLSKELGGTVATDSPLDKTFAADGEDALVNLTFNAQGASRGGFVKLVAAVVPGGIMEIRELSIDGRPVDLSSTSALADGRSRPVDPSTTSPKYLDVDGSSSR